MSRRNSDAGSPDFDDLEQTEPQRSRSVGKKRRKWPWVVVALALLIFYLPTIIASTSLRQSVINHALGEFDGRISIKKISLGWFSSVRLEGVEIYYEGAVPIVAVTRIRTSKPLIKLLLDDEIGEIELFEPVLNIELDDNKTNIERVLSKLVRANPNLKSHRANSDSQELSAFTIKCINGSANVSSTTSDDRWTLASIEMTAQAMSDGIPLAIEGTCEFTTGGTAYGGVAYTAHIDKGASSLSFSKAQIALSSQNLPLALAAPFLQRFIGPTTTIGYMDSELQMAYDLNSAQIAINIDQLELTGAGIAAPQLLDEDQLWTESMNIKGQFNLSPQQINAEQFEVTSDLGNFKANGVFDIAQLNRLVADGQLLDTSFSMSGKIDVARVANMIPHTLQLHEDLVVRSGMMNFQMSSHPQQDSAASRVVFNMDLANIHARRGDREIVWSKPLRIVGTVNQSDGLFGFDDMRIISDFLTVTGQGSLSSGKLNVKGDLAALIDRVRQFSDLNGLELAGILTGHCNWGTDVDSLPGAASSSDPLPIKINGRFDVANPAIHLPNARIWKPSLISARIQGTGITTSESFQIDKGNVNLKIGTEQLVATLRDPIDNVWNDEAWKLNCKMTGKLAGWIAHARNFIDLGDFQGAGEVGLSCLATVNTRDVRLDHIKFLVQPFQLDGWGLQIDEPKLDGKTNLSYDLVNGNIVIDNFSAATRSLSLKSDKLKLSPNDSFSLDGSARIEGDINRVAEWYGVSPQSTDFNWFGNAQGTITFNKKADRVSTRIKVRVKDLIAAQKVNASYPSNPPTQFAGQQYRWKEIWSEPEIDLDTTLAMRGDSDSVTIQNLDIRSTSLQLSTYGKLSQLSNVRPATPWLVIGQGVIVNQVELTPETCRKLLKFVAPLSADATDARGKLSISTEGIRIPIVYPMAISTRGTIQLSEVHIGAGPLARELLHSVDQIKLLLKPGSSRSPNNGSSWLQMPDQEVAFEIQNQRVFHDGLTFKYQGTRIRTKGSVGVDQTIQLIAEIPILASWIEDQPLLAGLKGQAVSIPISGTLSAPRLDLRALQQLPKRLLQETTGGAIKKMEGELGSFQREFNKAQNQINSNLQQDFGKKLEDEFKNGLDSLFKKSDGKK